MPIITAATSAMHALDGGGGPGNTSPSQGVLFGLALSRLLGWTYVACWIASFVPQVIINHKRRSVTGLSFDFLVLNVVGFACYTAFNLAFLSSETVRREYRERHGGNDNVAQWNDFAFAIWALLFSLIQLGQALVYRKRSGTHKLSTINKAVLAVIAFLIVGGFLLCWLDHENRLQWLDFVLLLSYIKLYITVVKFIPQMRLNYVRRSTQGFAIENILFDAAGGVLSLAQLLLDAGLSGDWSAVSGDLPKLLLSLISLGNDGILSYQHYVLYGPKQPAVTEEREEEENEQRLPQQTNSERTPLLSSDS